MDERISLYFANGHILYGLFFLTLTAAGLICLHFFLHLRHAEKILNAAKRESMDAAKILYNTPYPLVHYIPHEGILFYNPAMLKAFPDLPQKGISHPLLTELDSALAGMETKHYPSAREYEYEGVFYQQNIIPADSMGQKSIILYCYDVSLIKRTQAALEDSRKQAENANHAKSDFLANMSHELRTPMNGIIGLSGLLQNSDLGDPKNTELAQAIYNSSRALLVLLNDILDFSKIEAGELTLESIPFSPAEVMKQIENLQKPAASHKGITFRVDVEKNVPPFLKGDPIRLQQILNNLIGNAIKFTEKGEVRALLSGSFSADSIFTMHLDVSDTGIGIALEKQDKIFRKFTQADISTARKYGGTGLGLSITKHLVSLMGGNISLESREGEGSTFRVVMPFEIAERPADIKETKSGENRFKFKGKVLAVDDHPTNLLFLRTILQRMGIEDFNEALSGEDALRYAKTHRYDLIFMDCQMPEMDGYEAARRIRSEEGPSQTSPIIAVTANALKGAEDKCLDAGMNGYISKPVDYEKLMQTMDQYLERTDDLMLICENKILTDPLKYAAPPVFDRSRLDEFTAGDNAATERIIHLFLEQMEGDIGSLVSAFDNRNYESWKETTHKLYGACANVGAESLSLLCDRVHDARFQENDIKPLHGNILSEYRKLSDFLRQKEAA